MLARSTIAVALFCAAVTAQTTANDTIDPSSVSATTRSQWCVSEENVCGTLCSGNINENSCDPTTLNYTCTCTANGSEPGLIYYTGTMPTFICEQVFSDCNLANVGDAAAQALCATNEKANCGHLDPDNFTAAAATTSSAATSATSGAAASASSGATSTSSSAAGATLAAMRNFGTGALAVGVGAAFGYIL